MKINIFLSLLFSLMMCCSCGGDEPELDSELPPILPSVAWTEDEPVAQEVTPPDVAKIEGLNEETFPVIDGSDSTDP